MSIELGPYSNFHDLNLDWFLNEFNKVVEEWKTMQKNFNSLQDAFNDLKSYVQNYFKNLDVQEEINKKLDEMLKNGNLSELLLEYCIIPTITPQYLGSRLIERAVAPYAEENIDTTIPFEMEGICHVAKDRVVCFYSQGGIGNITKTSKVLVEEYDISVPFNPSRIRSATLTGLMHANACCYNDGKIYVATWGYYDSDTLVDSNVCVIVDYETLTVSESFEISGIPALQKIAYENGKFFGMHKLNVYDIDMSSKSATYRCGVTTPYTNTQGLMVIDNIGYISNYNPMLIISFNMISGNVINIYNLSSYLGNGLLYNAIADLSIYDDDIIITPHIELDNARASFNNPYVSCTVYGNYIAKISRTNKTVGLTGQNWYDINSMYVQGEIPDNIEYCVGSNSLPFRCMNEALYNKYRDDYSMNINSDVTVRGVLSLNNKHVGIKSINCYGYLANNSFVTANSCSVNKGIVNINKSICLHGFSDASELYASSCMFISRNLLANANLNGCVLMGACRYDSANTISNTTGVFRNYTNTKSIDLTNLTSLVYELQVQHGDNASSFLIQNGISFTFDGVDISMSNNIITFSDNCNAIVKM